MRRHFCLTGIALVATAVLSSPAAAQKVAVEEPIFSDHTRPPASVPEMAQSADAIVVATYTGQKRFVASPLAGVDALTTTAFTFQITEVIKFNSSLPGVGGTMEVFLPGGDNEYATHIQRLKLTNADELQANNAYVIFFRWNQVKNELGLAWVQDSFYNVTAPTVRSVGRDNPFLDGQGVSAFLNTLRNP